MTQGLRSARLPAPEDAKPPTDLRLVGPALATWAGCVVSIWGSVVAGYLVTGACAAVLAVCFMFRRRLEPLLPAAAAILCCLAAGATIAALKVQAAQQDQLTILAQDAARVTVELTVTGDPLPLDSGFAGADDSFSDPAGVPASEQDRGSAAGPKAPDTRYLLRTSAINVSSRNQQWSADGGLTLFVKGAEWGQIIPGDELRVSGTLRPDQFSVLPGAALSVRGAPEILAPAPWWQQAAHHVRLRFVLASSVLEPEPAGLLPGLILGDTTGIGERLDADAKASGLAHLLAVSGTHFAILCGAAMVLFRQAGPKRAALLGFLVLVTLVILVRPGPSVLRAAVMGAVTLLAFLVGRTRTALPALAAAVIALLLYDPVMSVNAGFALSVQATAGLVLIAPPWSESLQRRGFPAGWADLLVIPVVAHLATTPVIAALSGAISLASVPANILVAPVVAPALILGAIAALVALVWMDGAQILIHLIGPMVNWIARVAHMAADWPLAQLPWPSTPSGVLTLTAIMLAVVLAMRGRRTRAVIAGSAAGLLIVVIPSQTLSLGWPPADWLVVGCDVGQGDAFVMSNHTDGAAIVFDTGPDPAAVDQCLDRLRITTVTLLVLTHLHADHVDGLAGVLDGRAVGAIAVGPGRDPASTWNAVQDQAQTRGVPLVQLRIGQRLESGDVELTVLGPDPARVNAYLGPNDQSLVIRAETAGVRVLFTGDIEDAAQLALLESGVDLSADVLKLPHHGSAKLLPRFVEAVRASVVMIGVGVDNDFGHPTDSALQSVANAGARVILRTDTDGDIAVCRTESGLSTATRGAPIRAGP